MRKGLYICARLVGLLITLILAAVLAVQHPRVQTELVRLAVDKIESAFDGHLSYSAIKVLPFNAVLVKDALVMDGHPYSEEMHPDWEPADTFFYARTITATLTLKGLASKNGLHFHRVNISDGMMHMVVEPDSIYSCNLTRIFDIPRKDGRPEPGGNVFDIAKLKMTGFRYRMNHYMMPEHYNPGNGINYGDMDAVIDLRGHGVRFSGNRMYGTCDAMSISEKCGYTLKDITGSAAVGMGKAVFRDVRLVDRWSDLRMPEFSMTYVNGWTFAPFNDNVVMEGWFKPSTLSMKTISAYTGALDGNDILWKINGGHAKGYVTDFAVYGFSFTDLTSGISGVTDGSCIGASTGSPIGLGFKIHNLEFTPESLSGFIASWAPGTELHLEKKIPDQRFTLSGHGGGSLDKLDFSGTLKPHRGKAEIQVQARNLASSERGIELDGRVKTQDVLISSFTDIDALGACSLETGLRTRFQGKSTSVEVDSLKISRLEAMGYNYSGITAKGRFTGDSFDGKLVCSDPNLNFMFKGIFNLSKRTNNALYKFYANLGYADLKALNIDTRGGESKASCQVSANFMRIKRGDLLGDINVRNLYLENDEGPHDIGEINIGSHSNNNINRIQFSSSFADGGYVGTKAIGSLWEDLQTLTARKHLPALYSSAAGKEKSEEYDLSLNMHDSRDLLSFVMPGAYIADSTRLSMRINRDGEVNASVKSSRIAYGMNYLKNLALDADNLDGSLNCIATADEISAGGIGFRNSALTAYGRDNGFSASFHYDGMTGVDNLGEIYLNGEFSRDESDSLVIKAKPLASYVLFQDEQWDISESEITISKEGLSIDGGFSLGCNDQKLAISGGISRTHSDTLQVKLDNFDLAIVDRFLEKDYGLSGRTSGTAMLASPVSGSPDLDSRLHCDSLAIGGQYAGSMDIGGKWDKEREAFLLDITNGKDGRNALALNASFDPVTKILDAGADLDRFEIMGAAPFISSVFSAADGSLTGRINASGPIDTLDISSSALAFNDVKLTVGYTGVPYTLNGPFHLDNTGLYMDNVTVKDSKKGTGAIVGALKFDRLRNPELDLGVRMKSLQALNKPRGSENGVYGNLAVSGQATVTGPFDAVHVDSNILADSEGEVYVPLVGGSASASGGSDLLTFVKKEEYIDPYEMMVKKMSVKKKSTGTFTARADVSITPAVNAIVKMDSATGNEINASGSGTISIDLDTRKDIFNLNGNYAIDNGSYRFELPGVVTKDFTISNGSSLKFSGGILDTELDIKAIHQLKTSLSKLTADTTSVATRRTVECGISITDKIRNPQLAFDIQVPDLDPTTAAQVQSALNTEDKVQKQFISLLLFNTFLPDEISGVMNGSDMVFSNVSEIMSGQLNNILQKLEIPLDLGFNYTQNDGGTDIFDVAFSSQLFNNRVVVNGSVGNRKFSTSSSENGDIVGDIDIEYKIDNQGQFRVKLFSHSADQYSSYLDLSQRNGAGITWQKEYNRFSEFLKSIFSSKEKREQRALEAALAPEEEKTVIKIE